MDVLANAVELAEAENRAAAEERAAAERAAAERAAAERAAAERAAAELAEAQRVAAEAQRVAAEAQLVAAEAQLVAAEAQRVAAEERAAAERSEAERAAAVLAVEHAAYVALRPARSYPFNLQRTNELIEKLDAAFKSFQSMLFILRRSNLILAMSKEDVFAIFKMNIVDNTILETRGIRAHTVDVGRLAESLGLKVTEGPLVLEGRRAALVPAKNSYEYSLRISNQLVKKMGRVFNNIHSLVFMLRTYEHVLVMSMAEVDIIDAARQLHPEMTLTLKAHTAAIKSLAVLRGYTVIVDVGSPAEGEGGQEQAGGGGGQEQAGGGGGGQEQAGGGGGQEQAGGGQEER